jgi:hypothetical protein
VPAGAGVVADEIQGHADPQVCVERRLVVLQRPFVERDRVALLPRLVQFPRLRNQRNRVGGRWLRGGSERNRQNHEGRKAGRAHAA